jgi:hypothetical protein
MMRLSTLTAAAVLALAASLPAQTPPFGPLDRGVTAFVDVSVVAMERDGEPVAEHQTVVVRDGRIAEVGPAARVRVPAGRPASRGAASS